MGNINGLGHRVTNVQTGQTYSKTMSGRIVRHDTVAGQYYLLSLDGHKWDAQVWLAIPPNDPIDQNTAFTIAELFLEPSDYAILAWLRSCRASVENTVLGLTFIQGIEQFYEAHMQQYIQRLQPVYENIVVPVFHFSRSLWNIFRHPFYALNAIGLINGHAQRLFPHVIQGLGQTSQFFIG